MIKRRILLAFSLAACTAPAAFADLVQRDGNTSAPDRLEQLSQTLSQGSYISPADAKANTQVNVKLRNSSTVINNETLAQKYNSNTKTRYSAANSANPWLVTHPLPDMVRTSSNFGGREMGGRAENHGGVDLSAPSGTPIYATGPGIITKSGWGRGYGNYVEIDHGNGVLTRYAHASRLIAQVGSRVSAGDHIANVGCTGRCTGPHLHYEVVKDGQRKNPSSYLAMLP